MKPEFTKLNAELVCVFREEKKGAEGLKIAIKKTGYETILLDTPAKETLAYSQKDFTTYLIDEKGVIVAEFSGTKTTRPSGAEILEKAKEVLKK